MFAWLNNLLIAFAGRYKDKIPGQEAYREDRRQKNKACREVREITGARLWAVLGLRAFSDRKIFFFFLFFQLSLLLTSSGGKLLEDDIHRAGDSNVTSALCLEQRLLVPLHPVGCCAVRGAELVCAARPPRGTQPPLGGSQGTSCKRPLIFS